MTSEKTTDSDPWGEEIDLQIRSEDASPVCVRCFTPQAHAQWFCPECGASTGPYNNSMEYLRLFAVGEVLRNGVNGSIRHSKLTITGYVLLSASCYFVLAPVYWYRLWEDVRRPRPAQPPPLPDERI